MRVKISYGAEIQEVPEELEQLYTYVSEKVRALQVQTEHIEDAYAEEEIDLALPLIDKMRKTLSSIDQRLSDLEMISVGYLNYKQGDGNVHNGRPSVATAEDGSAATRTNATTED